MMLKEIELQKEQLQEDILCILDGLDDEYLTAICKIIVDRFNILIDLVNSQLSQPEGRGLHAKIKND